MGLSSATRRFKSIRRKRDRMPAGTIIDNAGQVYTPASSGPNIDEVEDSHPPAGFASPSVPPAIATRGVEKDGSGLPLTSPMPIGTGGGDPTLPTGQAPPPLPSIPSDIISKTDMAGSATQDDIMVYRLNSWRYIVREYASYFEAILSAQKSAKKAIDKAMGDFSIPLKDDHCFTSFDRVGVQQLSMKLNDVHRMYAAQQAAVIQGLESDTLDQLEKLRVEIKDSLKLYTEHLNPIYRRLRKQAKEVEEYKEKLVHAVEAYKKKHKSSDAWLIQQQIRRELTKQAELENTLYKAVQAERERLARWEVTVAERLRDIVGSAMVRDRGSAQTNMDAINSCIGYLDRFDTFAETRAFEHQFGGVFKSPMGLTGESSLADYDYMYRDSEPTTVLLEGHLEREKGLIKKFHSTYAVLTVQGYLHCYSDQQKLLEKDPDVSFHLVDCSLARTETPGTFVISVKDKKLGRSKYQFRSLDPKYVDHWVDAISSAITRPHSIEPQIYGGTLRNYSAAKEAAEANVNRSNTLPTAAGVTVAELATRNANEDAYTAYTEEEKRKSVTGSSSANRSVVNGEGKDGEDLDVKRDGLPPPPPPPNRDTIATSHGAAATDAHPVETPMSAMDEFYAAQDYPDSAAARAANGDAGGNEHQQHNNGSEGTIHGSEGHNKEHEREDNAAVISAMPEPHHHPSTAGNAE